MKSTTGFDLFDNTVIEPQAICGGKSGKSNLLTASMNPPKAAPLILQSTSVATTAPASEEIRPMRTRILIVDDHRLVRRGFQALLAAIPDFEVVGEAADGREALQLIRALAPNIVLMDISMPELNGLDATAHALREQPQLKVIIVSMHVSEAYVVEALRAGVDGYLCKNADAGELEYAIRAVMAGQRYLCPTVAQHANEGGMGSEYIATAAKIEKIISPRQREVLQLIAEGHSTREMAERLNLSVKTIETHRAQLMQRLDIFDVAGLTRHALRIGLVDPAR